MNHEQLFSWEKLFHDIRLQRRSQRWTSVETATYLSRGTLIFASNILDASILLTRFVNWSAPKLENASIRALKGSYSLITT